MDGQNRRAQRDIIKIHDNATVIYAVIYARPELAPRGKREARAVALHWDKDDGTTSSTSITDLEF